MNLINFLYVLSVISFLHVRICSFLRYRHDERPGTDTQIVALAKATMRRHKRNMVLLTAMALVFSITWLPLTILNVVADLDHKLFKEKQYNLLHAISLLIAMSSSVANPIMYGFFNSNFRRAFCDIIKVSSDSKSFDMKSRENASASRRQCLDFRSSGKNSSLRNTGEKRKLEGMCRLPFKKAASLVQLTTPKYCYGAIRGQYLQQGFKDGISETNSCPELAPTARKTDTLKETDKLNYAIQMPIADDSYESISSK